MSDIKSIQILLDVDLWAAVRARAALLKRSAASVADEALRGWLAGSEGSDVGRAQRSNGAGELPRCACGHLETVHLGGKRCQAVGCDCRKVAPGEDRT